MARPKKQAAHRVEPEDISQEVPEEEPAAEEEADEPEPAPDATMTKADVCRALLAEGITENEDAVAAAKSRFGVEIKPTDFSLYKSKEKKKQAGSTPKAKRGRKPRQEADAAPAAPAPKPAAGVDIDMVSDLAAIKHLVQRLGADQVRKIVDLFE